MLACGVFQMKLCRLTISLACVAFVALLVGFLGLANADAATTTYTNSGVFGAQLGGTVVNNYENPSYALIQSNAAMNAVLGETKYTPTGNPNINLVFDFSANGNHVYCAGCNGCRSVASPALNAEAPAM
jgi:hypothetical protein